MSPGPRVALEDRQLQSRQANAAFEPQRLRLRVLRDTDTSFPWLTGLRWHKTHPRREPMLVLPPASPSFRQKNPHGWARPASNRHSQPHRPSSSSQCFTPHSASVASSHWSRQRMESIITVPRPRGGIPPFCPAHVPVPRVALVTRGHAPLLKPPSGGSHLQSGLYAVVSRSWRCCQGLEWPDTQTARTSVRPRPRRPLAHCAT